MTRMSRKVRRSEQGLWRSQGGESSSSSSASGSNGNDDDDRDDDENEGVEDSENPCIVDSVEIRFQGGGTEEEQEVESCLTDAGAMSRNHRIHILREGHEVATDDDEDRGISGKHALSA
jgi:hypothetical protein